MGNAKAHAFAQKNKKTLFLNSIFSTKLHFSKSLGLYEKIQSFQQTFFQPKYFFRTSLNENVIGRLKRFKILSEKYRNRRKRFGQINLIAGIHNRELKHDDRDQNTIKTSFF